MKKATTRSPRKARRSVRTNVVLDQGLVATVKRLAGVRTTRDALHVALQHYTRSRDYSAITRLYGSGGVASGYDPKAAAPSRR